MIEDPQRDEDPGQIGGPGPDYDVDEAHRPLQESGEGEAEGFEEAERELVEEASHGEGAWDPEADEFPEEKESDLATGESGEADEAQPRDL